jgi:hypothetical protein
MVKKPGARKQYEDRQPIRLLLPNDVVEYIDSKTKNRTQWLSEAAKEKKEREAMNLNDVEKMSQRQQVMGAAGHLNCDNPSRRELAKEIQPYTTLTIDQIESELLDWRYDLSRGIERNDY